MNSEITDLRTAIELLKTIPGQYMETDVEADPICEIPGVYRYVGAGGTVSRPTQEGPAVVFNNVKNYPGKRLLIGMLASRKRTAYLLGEKTERIAFRLREAVKHVIPPIVVGSEKAKCQEVVYRAEDPDFDIRNIIPTMQSTALDAGPCITMGLCQASDPITGESDVTIHRMFVLDKPDEITFNYGSARHIGMMYEKAQALGKPLPISVSIGLDPAVYIGACFEPPTTPFGFNELGIAGALRGKPIELVPCLTVPELAIANAEFVIEGELLPEIRVAEDCLTGNCRAIPEFPGYVGNTYMVPVLKVKAVTHRIDPIYQTCIGASEEHVSMAGPSMEAGIIDMIERAMPGKLMNVYAHPAGGGKLMAVLQFRKTKPTDEGRERQAALLAFSAFSELKHVFLVDEDVDPFDSSDVLWALTTRYQGDFDTIFIPGVRCHRADPSSTVEYSPFIRADGASCKTIFDCMVPYALKDQFQRATFMELDPKMYFPNLF